jgi:hypothetical protein
MVPLASLAACTAVPPPRLIAARRDFSHDHYCPLRRTSAVEVDVTPRAPPAIAADPERLALWRVVARDRMGEARWLAVTGCDERAIYACYDVSLGPEPRRRGQRAVTGAACLEERPPSENANAVAPETQASPP